MASSQGIRAGSAYVEIDATDDKFNKVVDRVANKMRGVGRTLAGIGSGLAFGGVGSAAIFSGTIKAAIQYEGTMRRFKAVYGDAAKDAQAWAAETAKATGRAESSVVGALTTFGALFAGSGFASGQAAALSKEVTSLAQDFSSFYGITDDEALDRLRSALTGSSEVMDQFGVNIKEAAIEQELLATGIGKTSANASEQEKMLARIGIITKSFRGQGALGDAERNAGSAANKLAALKGKAGELAVTIGGALLPAIEPIVGVIGRVIGRFAEWARANGELSLTLGSAAVGLTAFGIAGGSTLLLASKLLAGVVAITDAFVKLRGAGAFASFLGPWGLAIAAITVAAGVGVYALDKYGQAVAHTSDIAAKALAKNDASRAVDHLTLNRLGQLADKYSLTAAEQAEVTASVGALNDRYESLGLTFDRTTGKIGNVVGAYARLDRAQRDRAVADIDVDLREKTFNLEELQRRRKSLNDGVGDVIVGAIGNFFSGVFGDGSDPRAQEIAKTIDGIKAVEAAMADLQKRRGTR